MNILFLTIAKIDEIETSSLFKDLLRKFAKEGHNLYIVSPAERRYNEPTHVINNGNVCILKVRTLNIQQCSFLEKGLSTILIESQFYRAINKYFIGVKFDLVLYTTPPISFVKIIDKIKKHFKARSYLMLKDIFPQNAVDLGLFSNKSLIYRYFRLKEKKLYQLSDYIGCMSPANVDYLISHNKSIDSNCVEICPNSIDIEANLLKVDKFAVRYEYKIPNDALLFFYGGNLGKPQGIDFLLDVLKSQINNMRVFFLIIGSGTEYDKINNWIFTSKARNVQLHAYVPKEKYNYLLCSADVGLIFLDKRFTIPNFPTRLLGYLLNKMPVLMAIDKSTDVGKIVENNKCGFWVESGDLVRFNEKIDFFINNKNSIKIMGENGYKMLVDGYGVNRTYETIMRHF